MSTAFVVVSIVGAAMMGFSAYALQFRISFVIDSMTEYRVPRSWWPWLAAAKAAGALGLIAGLFVPALGLAAAICLVLYFVGAEITVLHARSYSHIPVPLVYMAPAAACVALALA